MKNESGNENILSRIAEESGIALRAVSAVAKLLSEGATIPFIARYRKEAHGNLDEVKISTIQTRLNYFTELEERKATIISAISAQDKLTEELRSKILDCWQKSALEDLYQPYKPKRRTRAQVAKEKGFEPLAESIWNNESFDESDESALQYARDIIAERIADMADVRGYVRNQFATKAHLRCEVVTPRPTQPTKYEQYYDFEEPLQTMPSHRFLAIRRGQTEKILWAHLELDTEDVIEHMLEMLKVRPQDGNFAQVSLSARDAYKRLLSVSCELDALADKKLAADRAAVEVFAENLRHLLLAAPLGEKAVLAIDPGIRTGCKVAMMDARGRYLGKTVIFPQQKKLEAEKAIALIVHKYKVEAIAIGNGTAGRETEQFVRETLAKLHQQHPEIATPLVVSVSESGASVYSASQIARDEFPDLDLTVRGAISIGRRLQDPLAELVKIDPKAIGVGQYQHDVNERLLSDKLNEVVVSCVNGVGVELNTASAPLLERVSGLSPALAKAIIELRNDLGGFSSREELRKVKGLGVKAFEQAAGFLRIRGAKNPLDRSAVHPERYSLVETMAKDIGMSVEELVGNSLAAKKIDIRKYISNDVGEPTLRDIVAELVKPGRDPRSTFEMPKFRGDVTKIEDVQEGMKLEGVVTNVTAFGAFVDIGVHQDGLIHISELSDNFVRDPADVVKAGDKIKVTVVGVDRERNRIALSAKTHPTAGGAGSGGGDAKKQHARTIVGNGNRSGFSCNPFANL